MTTRRREILCVVALAFCPVLCLSEERPRDLFDGAAETARMVDDSYRRIYRLVEVAEALTTADEPTRASALLDEAAKGVGQIATEDWRDAAWVEIARARIALKIAAPSPRIGRSGARRPGSGRT